MKRAQFIRILVASTVLIIGIKLPALAHVKWFSTFSFTQKPLTLPEIFSPLFLTLLLSCVAVIGALVFVDDRITRLGWYTWFSQRLGRYALKSDLIVRVAVGAVLLLSWQSGTLLVPELVVNSAWIEFIQLTLAIMILANRYTAYAGLGLTGLYLFAFITFGTIHMLDYTYLLGAGYYLMVSSSFNKKKRASALPALYASVGFSLCWVALEKIVYPDWGLQILNANPQLALGFDPALFLQMSAFVEFILGFLLIVCLLQRPIALIITLVFISTTLVFGKIEIIGHAIVHAALIVFLIQGAGATFRTPITFFKRINQRIIFAVLSFSIIFLAMLVIYSGSASKQYELAMTSPPSGHESHTQIMEVSNSTTRPEFSMEILEDKYGGWNLHLTIENFVFSPEDCGNDHVDGYGHAHLYINDQKMARLYGPWFHIADLPPGKYEFKVVLTTNDHKEYALEGIPLSATRSLVVI